MKITVKDFTSTILPGLRAQFAARADLLTAVEAFTKSHEITDDEGNKVEISIADLGLKPEPEPVTKSATPELDQAVIDAAVQKALAKNPQPARRKEITIGDPNDIQVGDPVILKDKKAGYKSFGHFAMDVVQACTPGQAPSEHLVKWNKSLAGLQTKATVMNTSIGSEGGFLVPPDFVARLLEKPITDSPILSRCQQIPITGGNTIQIPYINETSRADVSRWGGFRAYRKAESTQYTQSDVNFAQLKLNAKKATLLLKVSDEMLRFSAISIEPILTRIFNNEFQFTMTKEVLIGDGASEMLGILNAPCTVRQSKETGQAAATIVYENVLNMWSRLYAPLRANAVWCVAQNTLPQLYKMALSVGTGGVPVFMPASGASGAPYATLFGRPIIECEACSTLGTVGDIMLAAFSEYVYAPVPGAEEFASSIHLYFDYGQTAFRATMYNDGAPWWSAALTPYNSGSTLSPFIKLATRS